MISQCMTEKKQFKLMHVKIDLRRVMVLNWNDQVQTIANPCQNKESKQKKHDKREKEMLMNVFSTRPFVLKRGRPR